MDDHISKPSSRYDDADVRNGGPCTRRSFGEKTKDVLLAELYTDFVPRWSKKKGVKLPNWETTSVVVSLSSALKLGIGIGFYPLLKAFNFGDYEVMIGSLAVYLVADGIYQLSDLRHPYEEGLRKAATLAVDLFSYPFYSMRSRSRNGHPPK